MQIKMAFRQKSTTESAQVHDTLARNFASPSVSARRRLTRPGMSVTEAAKVFMVSHNSAQPFWSKTT